MLRRKFINLSASTAIAAASCQVRKDPSDPRPVNYEALDQVLSTPLFKKELFDEPVIIESLELLRYRQNFICRVRDSNGATGYSVSNNMQMISLYPIFITRLQPFFIGKDARELETLLRQVYVYRSNYKLQNLALWVPLATIEFALLDLLGRIVNKPMGELIGSTVNKRISVYRANNFRGKSPEESLEGIVKNVEESGSKALKFKIGGRMSNNIDFPAGRTETLIPLVRSTFGDRMTIYADSNGSYSAEKAIEVGKLLEAYHIDFYEEPVPFDWYEETKQVADNLNIPIAGGEQEPSMHQFRWLIANDALDIVQPDIFYFGGMIRSMKVALMAHTRGKVCIPHISGSGLGYLYMMHFVSVLPNAGPFHEFKGFNSDIPLQCETSDLVTIDGSIQVPSGPGNGIEMDPEFIGRHEAVTG